MSDHSSPLNDDHLVQINDALEQAKRAKLMIEQAVRAGIDMGEQSKQVEELHRKLLRVGNTYFPGRVK